MATLFKIKGYDVRILTNDHPPPHVHVQGNNGFAKIDLGAKTGVLKLVECGGIPKGALRAIWFEVADRRTDLIRKWREIHGD